MQRDEGMDFLCCPGSGPILADDSAKGSNSRAGNQPLSPMPRLQSKIHMRLTPQPPALRRWRLWLGGVAVAELVWFVVLRPRGSLHAFFVLGLLPLTVVGYLYLMTAVSAYLSEREWDLRLRQIIVLMLGLSVGCFVFALLWFAKVHFENEVG